MTHARNLSNRSTDFVSVKDYGAVGDGTTDDTAAIQAAVTAASQVFIPPGTYKISSAIVLPANVELYGNGDASVLKLYANTVMLSVLTSSVTIRDLKIDGNSGAYTNVSNNAVYVNWTGSAQSRVVIKRVTIRNIAGAGVIALGVSGTPSSDIRIEGNDIENTGTHGIIVQDYVSNVFILGNRVKATGLLVADRPGITAARYGSNVTIANNICIGSVSALGSSVHGISSDLTTNSTISGNVISNWVGYGIEVGGSSNCTISANSINTTARAGIAISGNQTDPLLGSNVSIIGNNITSAATSGIYSFISGATGTMFHTNITVSGNVITSTTSDSGISLGFCNRLSITNNAVYGAFLSGLYTVDCKSVIVSANTLVNNNCVALKNILSITQTAGTATVTTAAAHGYSNGDIVTIINAVPAEYNGAYAIAGASGSTFTYSVSPAALQSPALAISGQIQCTKANSLAHGGVRANYSVLTTQEIVTFGHNMVVGNGYLDFYDVGYNGVIGFWNNLLFLRSTVQPRVENLTSNVAANQEDRAALFMKNGKISVAYNNAGALTYATLQLNGAATAWTNSTTTP